METNIIKSAETLELEELQDVMGGIRPKEREQDCTCDCWIGNNNK